MTEQDQITNDARIAVMAEQEVIGALLLDNDAIDRVQDLMPSHFYRADHAAIFSEIRRQIGMANRVDPLSLLEPLRGKVDDCMRYLIELRSNCGSSVVIRRHADIIMDKAMKREMMSIGRDLETAAIGSLTPAEELIASVSARLDELVKQKSGSDPVLLGDMLSDYANTIQRRMDGEEKPIAMGFADVDRMMGGGIERGTLTVVAGRPAMGKTAFGLTVARNVALDGVSLFLSMEMSSTQVNDRNIAAIGKIPVQWLRRPPENYGKGSIDEQHWDNMTRAYSLAQKYRLYIDDQTALNLLAIRSKARKVRRTAGALDLIVIDQLSFLTGAQSDKSYEQVGEYTRGLIALAKELNCAVMLLAQLNRKCEERTNKRPMAADLAQSGSIEQDASNIILLYRDEIYSPESPDKGVCEINVVKQRQGQPGTVGLGYVHDQTRFQDLAYQWNPHRRESDKPELGERRRGFGLPRN
jgi:replicative DNA helicase